MLHQQNGIAINVRKLSRFASAMRKDLHGKIGIFVMGQSSVVQGSGEWGA
jgi:hypothetical protein